jgi:hypothetical protein
MYSTWHDSLVHAVARTLQRIKTGEAGVSNLRRMNVERNLATITRGGGAQYSLRSLSIYDLDRMHSPRNPKIGGVEPRQLGADPAIRGHLQDIFCSLNDVPVNGIYQCSRCIYNSHNGLRV